MKNILICAQKGGIGKSTIADEIAFSFERTGIPFNFYELDVQGGTMHQTSSREDAVVSVIDTPPGVRDGIGDWLAEADILVVPTLLTARDIEPLEKMLELIKAGFHGQTLFVINRWDRFNASKHFLTWFNNVPDTDNRVVIPQSTIFAQALEYQESVVTYAKRSPAAQSVLGMVNKVREFAGFPAEVVL